VESKSKAFQAPVMKAYDVTGLTALTILNHATFEALRAVFLKMQVF